MLPVFLQQPLRKLQKLSSLDLVLELLLLNLLYLIYSKNCMFCARCYKQTIKSTLIRFSFHDYLSFITSNSDPIIWLGVAKSGFPVSKEITLIPFSLILRTLDVILLVMEGVMDNALSDHHFHIYLTVWIFISFSALSATLIASSLLLPLVTI